MRRQPMVHDRLERLRTPDGDHLTLARKGRPTPGQAQLLILHGLEGNIGAKYAHGLLTQAAARGCAGTLMLFRSCDGLLNAAPRLYHSGETTDIDLVVRALRAEAPESPLVVCGVSLGGNVLLKWLGERGAEARSLVARAAAVSVPFDLADGSRYLEHGVSRLYAAHFLKTLRTKALAKARQHPGIIDTSRAAAASTFWEFDNAVTAPLHGFSGSEDYYSKSSSIRFLKTITVPTLLLSAYDDPFVPPSVIDRVRTLATSTPAIQLEVTARGGHVGWVEGTPIPSKYYMEEVVTDYLFMSL